MVRVDVGQPQLETFQRRVLDEIGPPIDEVSALGAIRLVADQDEAAVSIESLANFESIPSSSVFSVRQAIETSLIQNPDLVALRQTEGVSAAALGVAETYQFNRWVQVQATPYQEDRVGGSGRTAHYVLVMQQIQLTHQQQHREAAAGAALNGVRWNLLQAELLNIAQTQRLYFTAVYQESLRDLARATTGNNEQLLKIIERQLAAGAAQGQRAPLGAIGGLGQRARRVVILYIRLRVVIHSTAHGGRAMASGIRIGLDEVLVHFSELEDPQSEVNLRHPLESVVVIPLMAVLAGASGPTSIARWALIKAELLTTLLSLPNGVPRKDVFRRVLSALQPETFQICFV